MFRPAHTLADVLRLAQGKRIPDTDMSLPSSFGVVTNHESFCCASYKLTSFKGMYRICAPGGK